MIKKILKIVGVLFLVFILFNVGMAIILGKSINQSKIASDLFFNICVSNITKPEDVRNAATYKMRHLDAAQAEPFQKLSMTKQAEIWMLSHPKYGQFILMLEPNGICTVIPREARASGLHMRLKQFYRNVDKKLDKRSGKVDYSYTVINSKEKKSIVRINEFLTPKDLMIMITTRSDVKDFAGLMTAAMVSKEK